MKYDEMNEQQVIAEVRQLMGRWMHDLGTTMARLIDAEIARGVLPMPILAETMNNVAMEAATTAAIALDQGYQDTDTTVATAMWHLRSCVINRLVEMKLRKPSRQDVRADTPVLMNGMVELRQRLIRAEQAYTAALTEGMQ